MPGISKRLPGILNAHKFKGERTMKKTVYRISLAVTVASLFLLNGVAFATKTDDRIESSAKKSYVFMTYLKNDNVEIQSKDGAVTLTGTVSEESHKTLAREAVVSMPGVKNVDDKLEVKNEDGAEYSDAWLIAKVKSTLLFHRNVNAMGTAVSAKEGRITLRGNASSQAQKDLTTEYVMDVDGVKKVDNELIVQKAPEKSGKKTVGEKMGAVGDSIDDASVTAMVKTTLLYHRSTSALKTTVETKDNVVTLSGNAGNAAERDLTTKLVSDVHGVKRVVNDMTVK